MRKGCLALGIAWVTVAAVPPRPVSRPQAWSALEARGATIGEIVIQVQPVFDPKIPAENNWVGRLANSIHVPTREAVVQRALLFKQGSRVVAREIYETERLLRALPFIKDAHIQLEPMEQNQVRAKVYVRDSWTLQVDAGYQQAGGQRSTRFGVQDQNFLGTGKTVGLSFERDHERADSQLNYRDPQFLGSRWTLDADYWRLSDGYGRKVAFRRPFFALHTPWAATLVGETRRSNLMIYDQRIGILEANTLVHRGRLASAWAVRQEEDRVWRAGLALDMRDWGYGPVTELAPWPDPPALLFDSRRQRGPALTLEYQQDAYQSFQDIQGMDTPEDYNLAWSGTLELGTYSRRLGSSLPGPHLKLRVAKAWTAAPGNLTLFQGKLSARTGGVKEESLKAASSVATYFQFSPSYELAGYLSLTWINRPNPEHVLYVGAADSLRGYPNNLHPGDRRWIASMEHRFFTQQRWWGIFRLGYMVFLDAGSIHQLNGRGWSPVYPDLGVGLRLGDLKSSLAKVLAFTASVPLERQPGQSKWQLGVANTLRF